MQKTICIVMWMFVIYLKSHHKKKHLNYNIKAFEMKSEVMSQNPGHLSLIFRINFITK